MSRLARSAMSPHRLVERAKIALRAADGQLSRAIAWSLRCDIRTVRLWRRRLAASPSIETLEDLQRSGRLPRVPLDVRCEVVKLACNRPAAHVRFRDTWTHGTLVEALWHPERVPSQLDR